MDTQQTRCLLSRTTPNTIVTVRPVLLDSARMLSKSFKTTTIPLLNKIVVKTSLTMALGTSCLKRIFIVMEVLPSGEEEEEEEEEGEEGEEGEEVEFPRK